MTPDSTLFALKPWWGNSVSLKLPFTLKTLHKTPINKDFQPPAPTTIERQRLVLKQYLAVASVQQFQKVALQDESHKLAAA